MNLSHSIAFMTEVTIDLKWADTKVLRISGFRFTVNETHCIITIKCFSDSGADESMISEKLV